MAMQQGAVETKVLWGFGIALAVLAILGALSYRATLEFMAASEAVARSHQVRANLAAVYSLMNQAETRQRGYIILGDEVDLSGRQAAVARLAELLAALEGLVGDDEAQRRRVEELKQSVATRLTLLDWVLEARRTQGFEAARARLEAGPGRLEMERLSALVGAMESAEGQALRQRVQAVQASARQTLIVFTLTLALACAFLVFLYRHIRREIAERRRAEERQTALLRGLESANEELENFAYVVSHDLKAPLRAIGTLAGWIAEDQGKRLDAQGKEHLRLLIQRIERMDRLIDGILLYSRVGRAHGPLGEVDLHALVHEVLDLLAPPAQVTVSIEGNLPTVRAERTPMQQVFQNLISNAVKYMDKPAGEIRIGCRDEGAAWRFHVSDNGPGIESRHFERIFQLFQTLAPKDRTEGSGVGLALVKKIVEYYGGRIWVESQPGAGSTFFFTLPK